MTSQPTVRARFAPSPTGYLHVGGARSALFNWLFCKQHGGSFILRIEDTDIQRNIEGAGDKLLDDLRWLGLDWDEGPDRPGPFGPYRQSERRDLYLEAQRRLLASGDAYYAFDTAEELDAMRNAAMAAKQSFQYPRPDPLPTEADADRARAEGRPVVVRFKAPQEPITVHDEILGDVTFAAGEVEDLVIVKSNGWPTYHFAVVVDDHHMQVTHVLRAQEHLMNTPKHVFIQRALGYATPKYAHLPLVFNIDGTKMSKRDKHKVVRKAVKERLAAPRQSGEAEAQAWTKGDAAGIANCSEDVFDQWLKKADTALDMDQVARLAEAAGVVMPEIDVHDFRVAGYLPEALLNFIALIGWSPGDDREKITIAEMIEAFSLERINKTAGRFDREKLLAMNTDYAAAATPERLLAAFRDWAGASGSAMAALDDATAAAALSACKGFRTFRDVETKVGPLFRPDDGIAFDPGAVKKALARQEGRGFAMLEQLLPAMAEIDDWSSASLERWIASFCEQQGVKLGDAAQPLRVAVTGTMISPAIGQTLALLGKERALSRIRNCLKRRG
jgi:glutamyl-tRNA synthetase